jgi:hypothetical protein
MQGVAEASCSNKLIPSHKVFIARKPTTTPKSFSNGFKSICIVFRVWRKSQQCGATDKSQWRMRQREGTRQGKKWKREEQ